MGKKDKKEIRRQQEASADLLAASKPVSGREDAAEEIVADKERSQGGEREKQLHGQSTKDANTVGVVVSPGTPPGDFVRPGTANDSDGLIGQPAERNAEHPGTEALDTSGEPLQPSLALPAPSAMAVEMANARAGVSVCCRRSSPTVCQAPWTPMRASGASPRCTARATARSARSPAAPRWRLGPRCARSTRAR